MNHGCVAIYVDEKLKFKCRDDLYSPEDETIIIEVVYKRLASFLLSITYRAPNIDNEWMLRFDIMVNKLLSENKEIVITGDFNFDTLSDAPLSRKWSELIQDLGLVQMINELTRVSKYSATLIDHIVVLHPEFVKRPK